MSTAGPLLPPPRHAAMNVFWLLTAINFLNYLDRIIFVAIGPELKHELHLTSSEVGLVSSAFLFIYSISALPLGIMADRGSRTHIIAFGVILWSLATWYTAIARTFPELFFGRAILGIGEASYIPAGAALLAAYFPSSERARVMSRWGASTLVGTALGFVAGGFIAQHFGWRFAFVLCGPPGLLLGWLAWRITDRRAYDEADLHAVKSAQTTTARRPASWREQFQQVFAQARETLRSRTVLLCIGVQALGLFVMTPALIFLPIYLREHFGLSIQMTNYLAGGVLIPAGIIGTLLGGAIADALSRRFSGGRMLAVMIGFGGAAPFFVIALLSRHLPMMLLFAFIAVAFLNMYNGPLNAAIQDVVPATLRATGFAVIMTASHLLGDNWSPSVIGWLADATHSVALALVFLGGPALVLGTILAYFGRGIYAREAASRPQDANIAAQAVVAPTLH